MVQGLGGEFSTDKNVCVRACVRVCACARACVHVHVFAHVLAFEIAVRDLGGLLFLNQYSLRCFI